MLLPPAPIPPLALRSLLAVLAFTLLLLVFAGGARPALAPGSLEADVLASQSLLLAAQSAQVGQRGYAAFLVAEQMAQRGDATGARRAYEQAIELGLSPLWEVASARRVAAAHRDEGRLQDAEGWLSWAAAAADANERRRVPIWFDGELVRRNREGSRSAVLLDLGSLREAAGDWTGAASVYAEIANAYPASDEAPTALQRLVELGAGSRVGGYERGLVHFYAGRAGEAIAELAAFLTAFPLEADAGAANYYLGLAWRNAGEWGSAIQALSTMASTYPQDRRAPDALYQAARLSDVYGTRAAAMPRYLAVADAFPASLEAARALAHAGWIEQRAGNAGGAEAAWGRLAQHPLAEGRAQGSFWLGREALRRGDPAGFGLLQEAAAGSPWTYEGLRAQEMLEWGVMAEPLQTSRATDLALGGPGGGVACEAAGIEQQASAADEAAADRAAPGGSAGAGEWLHRVDALLAAGLRAPALAEALDAALEQRAAPAELYLLARGLEERALYPASIYAGGHLSAALPAGGGEGLDGCVQRLLYPLAFADAVRTQAQRHGLDPYLLLALMRQESWFGTHALSGANARGLSQVIPPTAAEIARGLGRPGLNLDDLYRPDESILFGSWYLAKQIRDLGGRPMLAVAAYNAGPANAQRWTSGNPSVDPDDFAEAIDFVETRRYVRSVYEIYGRYRRLYGV